MTRWRVIGRCFLTALRSLSDLGPFCEQKTVIIFIKSLYGNQVAVDYVFVRGFLLFPGLDVSVPVLLPSVSFLSISYFTSVICRWFPLGDSSGLCFCLCLCLFINHDLCVYESIK